MKRIFYKYILPFALPLIKFYWFVFRPKTTGVKCVIRHGNEVLLIRNSYGLKLWTLPGGGVKHGETLEHAVIREVREEVGVTISNPKQYGSVFYDGEYKRNTIWVFETEITTKDFRVDGIEVEEVRWFPVNELPPKKSHLLAQFIQMTLRKEFIL